MSYLIYHTESTYILGGSNNRFATERAAKAGLTRACKKNKDLVKNEYSIADTSEFFNTIEKTVTRVNLMSGKEYQEKVNTPVYMSPACESYWSM